jgi:ppGpp synthetase/RelA/SpoT-type nucleotidyltranferase
VTVDDVYDLAPGLPATTELGRSDNEFAVPYEIAISTLTAKVRILKQEFTRGDGCCPIEAVSSRVKTHDSIVAKAQRVCCPLTADDIRANVLDIAGVRITCGRVSDAYRIAARLSELPDVTLIEVEDYIAKPKPNGYKSLHMTVELPVFLTNQVQQLPVEVQIKAIAQDLRASCEHTNSYEYPCDDDDNPGPKVTGRLGSPETAMPPGSIRSTLNARRLLMSAPTLHVDALGAGPTAFRGLRLRLKRAYPSGGFVQGAWWPRTDQLHTELPLLLTALAPRVVTVDRVIYDENNWAPASLPMEFRGRSITLEGSSTTSINTLSVIGEGLARLDLLVVPPFTHPIRAYTAVMTASKPDDVSDPDALLGIGPRAALVRREALMAHQRWESEVEALRHRRHTGGEGDVAADEVQEVRRA